VPGAFGPSAPCAWPALRLGPACAPERLRLGPALRPRTPCASARPAPPAPCASARPCAPGALCLGPALRPPGALCLGPALRPRAPWPRPGPVPWPGLRLRAALCLGRPCASARGARPRVHGVPVTPAAMVATTTPNEAHAKPGARVITKAIKHPSPVMPSAGA